MRSKDSFIVVQITEDAAKYALCHNGKFVDFLETGAKPGYRAYDLKFWNNSGNAWRCISKLVKNNSDFREFFVYIPATNSYAPFTEDDAMSFACLVSATSDHGAIEAIADEALKEKSEQIDIQEEIDTELRVSMTFHNSEDA